MDWVTPLIDILVKVLGNGTLLLGLIVAIGYALLKKPLRVVVSGFIKSAVGITLLLIGATTVVGVMLPIGDLSAQAIGVEGISVIGWFYAYILPMPVLGAAIGSVIISAFALNLVLARLR